MQKLFIGLCALISFTALAKNQDIIGQDERYLVLKSNASEVHKSIGLLDFRFGSKFYTCTGTVVGPRHVITAAHCIWDEGKMADEVIFYPGALETDDILEVTKGSYASKDFRLFESYLKIPSSNNDVGMIIFTENLPVKSLELTVVPSRSELRTQVASVSGYPNDKLYGTMWESSGVNTIERNFDFDSHYLDTTHGMSGAAIRIGSKVIGIHSRGDVPDISVRNPSHFFSKKSLKMVQVWMNSPKP